MSNAAQSVGEKVKPKGRYLLLSLVVIVFDQWSKWLVEARLPLYVSHEVIPNFLNFTHVKNTGVAFGFFAGTGGTAIGPWLLAGLGILAMSLVLIYFWRVDRSNQILLVALALVLGGAVGNLIDRIAAGAVTDFVDVYVGTYHWHTFNVADSAITVGIVLMVWDTLRSRHEQPQAEGA